MPHSGARLAESFGSEQGENFGQVSRLAACKVCMFVGGTIPIACRCYLNCKSLDLYRLIHIFSLSGARQAHRYVSKTCIPGIDSILDCFICPFMPIH